MSTALAFEVPPELQAGEPPEARGLARDAVRMMVASRDSGRIEHSSFSLLPSYLAAGDLVVINTSGTMPAAVNGMAADGTHVVVHLSTRLDDSRWVVELRKPAVPGTQQWEAEDGPLPPLLSLGEDSAVLELVAPYRGSTRLWVARLTLPAPEPMWLAVHGRPIRYGYVERPWPLTMYQTIYATDPGSAEMPSAGRPFTPEVITRLVAKGVGVTPVVLHTGVASLEGGELPYPERVSVPASTAARVNHTRDDGGRVVAVGTTVVRALESAIEPVTGRLAGFTGWTDLVITPERGVRAVDGLLTGWHEPEASHLLMLEAIAGLDLLEASYRASLDERYLWHEFGDVHLILP